MKQIKFDYDEGRLKQVILEKIRLSSNLPISSTAMSFIVNKRTNISKHENFLADEIIYQLSVMLTGKKLEEVENKTISYPATWWDAFKARYLKFLKVNLTRQTFEVRKYTVINVYPHLPEQLNDFHVYFCDTAKITQTHKTPEPSPSDSTSLSKEPES